MIDISASIQSSKETMGGVLRELVFRDFGGAIGSVLGRKIAAQRLSSVSYAG
jgi:hypothetical protein